MSTKGGDVPNQIPQRIICIIVQMGMLNFDAPDLLSPLILLPCVVTLKARTTVMVLAQTVDTATMNTTTNAISCRMQVAVLGVGTCPP